MGGYVRVLPLSFLYLFCHCFPSLFPFVPLVSLSTTNSLLSSSLSFPLSPTLSLTLSSSRSPPLSFFLSPPFSGTVAGTGVGDEKETNQMRSPLMIVESFLTALTSADKDGRIVICKAGWCS